jgi:hypothetical protein
MTKNDVIFVTKFIKSSLNIIINTNIGVILYKNYLYKMRGNIP